MSTAITGRPPARLEIAALGQARVELEEIGRQLQNEYPATNAEVMPEVVTLRAAETESLRPYLAMLAAASSMMLVICCANVASLMLMRATRRRRELALRWALGAGLSVEFYLGNGSIYYRKSSSLRRLAFSGVLDPERPRDGLPFQMKGNAELWGQFDDDFSDGEPSFVHLEGELDFNNKFTQQKIEGAFPSRSSSWVGGLV